MTDESRTYDCGGIPVELITPKDEEAVIKHIKRVSELE